MVLILELEQLVRNHQNQVKLDLSIGLNEDVKLDYTFPKNIFKLYQHMLDLMK